jgi:tRNA threonylcarbamoyladenosine biosynthesis protein TsaE
VITVCSDGPEGTRAIAAAIAGLARAGDLVLLAGEMGAGKTVFAQGFGAALGVTDPITSPTFVLVHSYAGGRVPLHHADLYRLERTGEVADLALDELLEASGVVLVEWGDVVGRSLGDDRLLVTLTVEPDDVERRRITVEGSGRSWARRWEALGAALEGWSC